MKSSNSEIRIWDRFAKHYDRFIRKTLGETYVELYNQIKSDITSDDTVLEVATGTGLISFEIAKYVSHIDAVDLSPQMIEVAKDIQTKTQIKNIEFTCSDANKLPFENGSFDIVIASNLLHLLKEPNIALAEMSRVLKKDGKLILPTFCHAENLTSKLISFFMSLPGFKFYNKWSVDNFENYIVSCGFNVIKRKVIVGKIPLTYLVVKK